MLLRGTSRLMRANRGLFSTAAGSKVKYEEFRTTETNPSNHTPAHIGKYYQIDPEVKQKLFKTGGITKSYEKQIKTFNESCLMIRSPAVEIMNYIKNTDFSKPVNRYVLYGDVGTGKSMTLVHLLHYGHLNDFLLVHVPWIPYWYKRPKGRAYGPSATQEGYTDLPVTSVSWLSHFKNQNAELLAKLNLVTSQDYVWSKRETTPKGSPLIELIDHGTSRAKYATDVIKVLLDEIKQQSTEGKVKTLVAIDGYNVLFYEQTNMKAKFKVPIPSDKITLTQPFLDLVKHDWCNGLCVLTVDQIAMKGFVRESNLPLYLLGREGFEHLDPFVPIRHENYDEKEFESCIQYYVDRKWVQNINQGFDKELEFLSNKNPYKLMDLCKSL